MNIRAKVFGTKVPEEPILQAKDPKGVVADALNSVPVARQEQRRGNSRVDDRHRLASERVRVTHAGSDHEAELINLSGGGAMVSADFKPLLWDKVELHLGAHGTIECAVLWVRDGRIGLEFAHETRLDCEADEQAQLLREVIARSFPDVQFCEKPEAASKPAEKNQTPTDEQRSAPRHPLIWSGVLHHDFQSTPVRVRNISQIGAMIETKSPVRVGSEPLLDLGDSASISATVEWVVGDQVGLRFHNEFDMQLLAKSQPEMTPVRWVRPAYLDSAGEPDSPWDERWGRLSLGELNEELEGFLKR